MGLQTDWRSVSADGYPSVRELAAAQPAPVPGTADVAEGAGLAHDAGNLLGALSLYSDLLAMPGVLHEEHRDYAAELRMLSDRSWAMHDRPSGKPCRLRAENEGRSR
jgi:hypothetical protein